MLYLEIFELFRGGSVSMRAFFWRGTRSCDTFQGTNGQRGVGIDRLSLVTIEMSFNSVQISS